MSKKENKTVAAFGPLESTAETEPAESRPGQGWNSEPATEYEAGLNSNIAYFPRYRTIQIDKETRDLLKMESRLTERTQADILAELFTRFTKAVEEHNSNFSQPYQLPNKKIFDIAAELAMTPCSERVAIGFPMPDILYKRFNTASKQVYGSKVCHVIYLIREWIDENHKNNR